MTDTQATFQRSALQLAERQNSPQWLSNLRTQGAEQFAQAQWPGRKTEAWKYTPLAPLQKTAFTQWADAASPDVVSSDWLEIDATRLVFINGVFSAKHSSSELPAAVVRFADANGEQQGIIKQHLGTVVDAERHLFAALSNAWADDGVLVHVPVGQALDKPVYLVNVSTLQAEAAVASQRLLIVAEQNAQASVIEHFLSSSDTQNGFVNSLTEIVVADNAEVKHSRLNLEQEDLLHVGGVHVNLARSARLNGFTLATGSRLKRIDYQVSHRGEGAELTLNGVYVPRNRQLVDYHTTVDHCVPHCTTSETFRGIVGDSARAVFNGRIHIHPQAQKSLAELSNKNLLTSNKAEVDTKPELEIYADDVKCAHGATVSQLDETAMYYLQSRGIANAEAEVMLSFGFINEIIRQAPEPAIQDFLYARLGALLGRTDELLTHMASADNDQE